jgi:hypothetical protein
MRGIPIGNFFSKQELFYLTHIHENRAPHIDWTWGHKLFITSPCIMLGFNEKILGIYNKNLSFK